MRGPIGHLITGITAGILIGRGNYREGVYISALVQIRQTVSWLHKRDKVGKDLMEHIIGVYIGLPIGLLLRSDETRKRYQSRTS